VIFGRNGANEMAAVLVAEIFKHSTWNAELVRVGPVIELSRLVEYATDRGMITEELRLNYNEAIVGHAAPLDDFQQYINNHCKNSFKIHRMRQPTRMTLRETGEAVGEIKKQCSSADQYAFLRIRTTPRNETSEVTLSIPSDHSVAEQIHHSSISEAIRHGLKIASCHTFPEVMISGYDVEVLKGKYHDIDSHAGAFQNAARIAMSEILRTQFGQNR